MGDASIYEHLLRLARLLQAQERIAAPGLQPVQLHSLFYLDRCNRYSDRPAVVAEYLGITKGTASQTLRVLEEAGLIVKQVDAGDRRVVHLSLTRKGRHALKAAGPPKILDRALDSLLDRDRRQLESALPRLLRALQQVNRGRSFGVCQTCRHFLSEDGEKYRCGLTSEPLAARETQLLCREHEERSAVA